MPRSSSSRSIAVARLPSSATRRRRSLDCRRRGGRTRPPRRPRARRGRRTSPSRAGVGRPRPARAAAPSPRSTADGSTRRDLVRVQVEELAHVAVGARRAGRCASPGYSSCAASIPAKASKSTFGCARISVSTGIFAVIEIGVAGLQDDYDEAASGTLRGGAPCQPRSAPKPRTSRSANEDGQEVTLSSLRGQNVVLVFYPFAFSSICTKELHDVTGLADRFDAAGAQVFGISVDSPFALKAFRNATRASRRTCCPTSSPREPSRASTAPTSTDLGFATRATFVIDKDGTIAYKQVNSPGRGARPGGGPGGARRLPGLDPAPESAGASRYTGPVERRRRRRGRGRPRRTS